MSSFQLLAMPVRWPLPTTATTLEELRATLRRLATIYLPRNPPLQWPASYFQDLPRIYALCKYDTNKWVSIDKTIKDMIKISHQGPVTALLSIFWIFWNSNWKHALKNVAYKSRSRMSVSESVGKLLLNSCIINVISSFSSIVFICMDTRNEEL